MKHKYTQSDSQSTPYTGYGYDAQGYNPYGYMQYPYQGMPGQSGLQVPQMPSAPPTGAQQIPGMLPIEESYIENILRLNKGKKATIYMTFENNKEWNAKVFKGVIEAAGRDHIVISDPQTGKRYLLLMVYLDYITFDEEINYDLPIGTSHAGLSNYSPR